jgi:DNA polymerase I-like protein with 3'-5' exonuclease and polymerase domains
MPNRTDWGRKVCEGFICKPGWTFLSVDESQIEPRIAAHRSCDERLKNVYFNVGDIYSDYAITGFRLPDKRYKDDQGWHYPGVDKKRHRFPSKICILASIYDVTGAGLQVQMPVVCANCSNEVKEHDCGKFSPLWTENACQDLINNFYLTYPGLIDMKRMDHARMRKYAYVWDEWGRILHVAAVRSVLSWVVSAALREGANMPIQGTAQGTMHLCQAIIDDDFNRIGLYDPGLLEPHLQIHDEFLFSCRQDIADEIGGLVKEVIENCGGLKLEVPIKASIAKAEVWGKMPK